MYAVVGCGECTALWILEGRQETATCPRCGKRHRRASLRSFETTDDRQRARQVRTQLLADRSDLGESFETIADIDTAEALDEPVVPDDDYLRGSGIDPEEVRAAATDVTSGSPGGGDRKSRVLAAIDRLEDPMESAVLEELEARGIPPNQAEAMLEKLVAAGELIKHRDRYRRV